MMRDVRYPEFRHFNEERVKANDAVMGLLAGSQLASHFLQLTAGSNLQLAEIFPGVQHIKRFDLRSERARAILDSAEDHLCSMSIPYILALHEDYMSHCMEMLLTAGLVTPKIADDSRPAKVHGLFGSAIGSRLTPESVELFHYLRLIRNCRIHSGGHASPALTNHTTRLSQQALARWKTITGEPLAAYAIGDGIRYGQPELVASLAITKRLTDEANHALAANYPRNLWADILVADMFDVFKSLNQGLNSIQVERKIAGFRREYYDVLSLTDAELRPAFAKRGISYIGKTK